MTSRPPIHSNYASRRHALACVIVLALAAPSAAGAQARASGLQITPDAKRVLVNKDVGDERWALSLNDDDTVTGNVFRTDGSPPSFVWCEEVVDDGSTTDVTLACYGAAPCPAAPCTTDEWDFIADVVLPATFFAPPTSVPTATPTPSSTPRPTVTSSPATPSPSTPSPATPSPATPSPAPSVTSSPGDDGDIRCCVPDDGGTECEDRTPSECAQRGGTNLGPGSCDPNPCS